MTLTEIDVDVIYMPRTRVVSRRTHLDIHSLGNIKLLAQVIIGVQARGKLDMNNRKVK
jgi:hypothetical protein